MLAAQIEACQPFLMTCAQSGKCWPAIIIVECHFNALCVHTEHILSAGGSVDDKVLPYIRLSDSQP